VSFLIGSRFTDQTRRSVMVTTSKKLARLRNSQFILLALACLHNAPSMVRAVCIALAAWETTHFGWTSIWGTSVLHEGRLQVSSAQFSLGLSTVAIVVDLLVETLTLTLAKCIVSRCALSSAFRSLVTYAFEILLGVVNLGASSKSWLLAVT